MFGLTRARPAVVADAPAELQVRDAGVPLVFAETRPPAEEWTYRFLAAASSWVRGEQALGLRLAATRGGRGAGTDASPGGEGPRSRSARVRAFTGPNP